MRMVFDTNVVISALLFNSDNARFLRAAWSSERFIPVISTATVSELLRVLSYPKFKLSFEEQEVLLVEYLKHAETWTRVRSFQKHYPCSDPKDQPFIDLALSAKVVALVSGDVDLKSMHTQLPLPVYTWRDLHSFN